jgi:hypothetical protein
MRALFENLKHRNGRDFYSHEVHGWHIIKPSPGKSDWYGNIEWVALMCSELFADLYSAVSLCMNRPQRQWSQSSNHLKCSNSSPVSYIQMLIFLCVLRVITAKGIDSLLTKGLYGELTQNITNTTLGFCFSGSGQPRVLHIPQFRNSSFLVLHWSENSMHKLWQLNRWPSQKHCGQVPWPRVHGLRPTLAMALVSGHLWEQRDLIVAG